MDVTLFDFDLPPERIALRPVTPRETGRLLVVEDDRLRDATIADLTSLLRPSDVLVFNDTRVIPSHLEGLRPARDHGGGDGAKITVNLHKCVDANHWRAFVKPAKRLRSGDEIDFGPNLKAICLENPNEGELLLRFNCSGVELMEKLHTIGAPPLPPYIASKREIDARDIDDYQTIYADREGSVAAPTAGLHFTDQMMVDLKSKGIETEMVTLHVGAGTFLPVKVEDTENHIMHGEWGAVPHDVAGRLNAAKSEGRRVVAVGTTSLRLLESASDDNGVLHSFEDETDIFITPGYRFRFVDGLMTNFHLPKSTLFMLVSAFSGLERMQSAYAHAISKGYRFYSYGDACLLQASGAAV